MSDRRQAQEALLKKVDDLLNKHRPKAVARDVDALLDVPLLTEVAEDDVPTLASATAPTRKPKTSGHGLQDEELRLLASEIFERVLNHLDDHLTKELRRRMQLQVDRAVENAVTSIMGDLHREVLDSVGDAIAEVLVDHLGIAERRKAPR